MRSTFPVPLQWDQRRCPQHHRVTGPLPTSPRDVNLRAHHHSTPPSKLGTVSPPAGTSQTATGSRYGRRTVPEDTDLQVGTSHRSCPVSQVQTSCLPVIFVVKTSLSPPPNIYFQITAPNVVIPNSTPSIPGAPGAPRWMEKTAEPACMRLHNSEESLKRSFSILSQKNDIFHLFYYQFSTTAPNLSIL